MEKAIDDLKKQYKKTLLPMSHEEGLLDLMGRIENVRKVPFYFSKMFATLSVAIVLLTGFVGLTWASTPNTPLYPVKKATMHIVTNITNSNEELKTNITNIIKLNKKPTPTSALTPTPQQLDKEKNIEHSEIENEEKNNNNENKKSVSEVKGLNAVNPTMAAQKNNENSKQNQTPGNSSNNGQQDNGQSQENNGTPQVKERENNGKGNDKN